MLRPHIAVGAWTLALTSTPLAAEVPLPAGTDAVEGATEMAARIRQLDRDIEARRDELSPGQLEAVIEVRDSAAQELRDSVARQLQLPEGQRQVGPTARLTFYRADVAARRILDGGSDRVETRITAPQGWRIWRRPYDTSEQWQLYTNGESLDVGGWDFRLTRQQPDGECVYPAVEIWDDPTARELACP